MNVSDVEQNLLFAVSAVILLGTLVVFVWQCLRSRNRDKD